MHRTTGIVRAWAKRLALSGACGLMLSTAAYAQFPPGFNFPSFTPPAPTNSSNTTDQSPKQAGTVLTVPLKDFGTIVAQNSLRQKNVNLLQVSQVAVGDMNSQVATISIRQHNNQNPKNWEPAKQCYLPTWSLPWVKQSNKDSSIVEQAVVGYGNQQVAQVQVDQANQAKIKPNSRFVMCPLSGVPAIQALNQQNVNVVHVSQLALGDDNTQVAVLSVDQQNNAHPLKVPAQLAKPLVQLNMNLTIINQVAVGNGNTQVATVDVGQDNSVSKPGT
jgi:hypothetical protein